MFKKSETIGKEEEEEALKAEESNSLTFAETSSPTMPTTSALQPFDGITNQESAELHHAPTTIVGPNEGEFGDYPPINNFEDFKNIFSLESTKLWVIAGPIAFNILCNYGVNSFTNIFAGHLGDLELSTVAISLSVVANFSFGFLVSFPFIYLFLNIYLYNFFILFTVELY